MTYYRLRKIPGANNKEYGPYWYEVEGERHGDQVVQKFRHYWGKIGPTPEMLAKVRPHRTIPAETKAIEKKAKEFPETKPRPREEESPLEWMQREAGEVTGKPEGAAEVTGKPKEADLGGEIAVSGEKSGLEMLQEEAAEVTGKPKEAPYEELEEIPESKARAPAHRRKKAPKLRIPTVKPREPSGLDLAREQAEEGYTPPEQEPEEEAEEEEAPEAEAEAVAKIQIQIEGAEAEASRPGLGEKAREAIEFKIENLRQALEERRREAPTRKALMEAGRGVEAIAKEKLKERQKAIAAEKAEQKAIAETQRKAIAAREQEALADREKIRELAPGESYQPEREQLRPAELETSERFGETRAGKGPMAEGPIKDEKIKILQARKRPALKEPE